MADKVALAKKAEAERRELLDKIDTLQASVDALLAKLNETGAAKPAPKRSTRARKEVEA